MSASYHNGCKHKEIWSFYSYYTGSLYTHRTFDTFEIISIYEHSDNIRQATSNVTHNMQI